MDSAFDDLNVPAGRARSYEGVIRQLLAHLPRPPAVALVAFLRDNAHGDLVTPREVPGLYQFSNDG